jgi:alpha-tubulin suppressor-like RCC1 family protein
MLTTLMSAYATRCWRASVAAAFVLTLWVAGEVAANPAALSFGSNGLGRTGLNTDSGLTTIAASIDATNLAGKSIAQVAAGLSHSLLLADDGVVFSFGSNGNGQTGLNSTIGNTLVATPIDTTNLAGKTITQVAAGWDHNLLLAHDGTVFSFGDNAFGRTGLNTTVGDTLIPTPIIATNLGGKTIKQVAAGNTHSLLLADDGVVFSFGSNSLGRTGINSVAGNTTIATPINAANLGGKTITQIAAGNQHSLLLADDGTVFSFGFNGNGETGMNTDVGSTLVATEIDSTLLGGKTIAQIAAGNLHSLLLADDGTVFSFGFNGQSQTGLNSDVGNTLLATPIDATNLAGKTIVQVAGGGNHSLLLADDGTIFSFGLNSNGQTGLNTTIGKALIATPIDVTNLTGPHSRPIGIAAGFYHSLVIAVPEPASAATGLIAGLLFVARRRR